MKKSNVVFTNLIWRFAERCGAQGVTFVVSIVLARILNPSVYGIIALITVFTTILQVFVDGGFASALIQKKDADDVDFSTVFYFNLMMCVGLYIIMFICAPFIAKFYEMNELTAVIRVMCLIIIISGIKNVQQAYVSRHMLFKRFFFSTLGGTIGAAIVGIAMAYKGFGVWALVFQMLFNTLVDTLILWLTVKWRPQKVFSIDRLKILFSYGWKLLAANLVATVYTQLRQLVIGKMYSSEDLAFYNRGRQFPNLIVENINTSIDSVLFPALSNEQEDFKRVRDMTRRSIKVSTYIMAPLMIGLAVCAEPFVKLILTDKWIFCVPYLRIFCITFLFYPIQTANLNAIKATGRSGVLLKLQIIKNIIGFLLLLITMKFGPLAIAYGMLASSICSQIINSWPNRKILDYKYYQQLVDILPAVVLAVIMGGIISLIELLNVAPVFTLIIQILLGVVVYFGGSKVFKIDSLTYLRNVVYNYIK